VSTGCDLPNAAGVARRQHRRRRRHGLAGRQHEERLCRHVLSVACGLTDPARTCARLSPESAARRGGAAGGAGCRSRRGSGTAPRPVAGRRTRRSAAGRAGARRARQAAPSQDGDRRVRVQAPQLGEVRQPDPISVRDLTHRSGSPPKSDSLRKCLRALATLYVAASRNCCPGPPAKLAGLFRGYPAAVYARPTPEYTTTLPPQRRPRTAPFRVAGEGVPL